MNMNRITRTTLSATIFVVLGLSWVGCSKSAPKITAGPPPTGPVELKMKWQVGSRLVQSLNLQQTTETHVPGSPQPVKQDMTLGQKYQISVLKELPDGGREVEMKILGTQISVSAANQPAIKYDSADKSSTTNVLAATLQKLTGVTVRMFLNASGEVQRVEGMDELVKRIGDGAEGDSTGILKSLFSKDTLQNWMRSNRNLPDKPVQPGDTWPLQQEIPMGTLGTMVSDINYTFKSWERRNEHNCAHLEFEGVLKSKDGQDLQVQGMKMSIQNGKNSGESWFDLEEGMFVETLINQDLNLLVTVPKQPGARSGTPQTIALTLTQIITFKLERVE